MNKYFAEMVGTFVLVFGGVGSAVLAGSHIGYVGVALAFGLSLLAMVYTIGPISGCHVNPAVTFGVLLAGKINGKDAAMYVIAQIIGAIIAAAVILFVAHGISGGYDASVAGLGFRRLRLAFSRPLFPGCLLCRGGRPHHVSCIDCSRVYRREGPGWICGTRDRPGADADPPGWHPHHQYVSQSCAEHWTGAVCRRMGGAATVAVYCRPPDWRSHSSRRLCGDSAPSASHFYRAGGTSHARRTGGSGSLGRAPAAKRAAKKGRCRVRNSPLSG